MEGNFNKIEKCQWNFSLEVLFNFLLKIFDMVNKFTIFANKKNAPIKKCKDFLLSNF